MQMFSIYRVTGFGSMYMHLLENSYIAILSRKSIFFHGKRIGTKIVFLVDSFVKEISVVDSLLEGSLELVEHIV